MTALKKFYLHCSYSRILLITPLSILDCFLSFSKSNSRFWIFASYSALTASISNDELFLTWPSISLSYCISLKACINISSISSSTSVFAFLPEAIQFSLETVLLLSAYSSLIAFLNSYILYYSYKIDSLRRFPFFNYYSG